MANKDVDVQRSNNPAARNTDNDLMPDFEHMTERFLGGRFGSLLGEWPMTSARSTPVEIRETDKSYILCADIPGIPSEKVDVQVSGNMLSIHAESREEKSEGEEYSRQYRAFDQSFSLPSNVDADQIEANVEDGVLQIFIPKMKQAQPRKIETKSKGGGFFDRFRGKDKSENH